MYTAHLVYHHRVLQIQIHRCQNIKQIHINLKLHLVTVFLNQILIFPILNFYLIIGQNNDVNRKEIHLAGFKATSKVKSDPLDYTDYNNMVWGLLIPTANFKYPAESVTIQKTS